MTDSFSALHPALTFCYFAAVLLLTMFVLHPVFLALSLLSAPYLLWLLFAAYLNLGIWLLNR